MSEVWPGQFSVSLSDALFLHLHGMKYGRSKCLISVKCEKKGNFFPFVVPGGLGVCRSEGAGQTAGEAALGVRMKRHEYV